MNTYTKQANDFLKETNTTLKINFLDCMPYFDSDKKDGASRNVYFIILTRGNNKMRFKFGDSMNNTDKGGKPNSYDVLTCLNKYDPGTFEDFCGEFGYEVDSRQAFKTYKAVKKEFKDLSSLYNEEELEKLSEIQ
jgi:hypothetical protein